jgi:hypothetical protein
MSCGLELITTNILLLILQKYYNFVIPNTRLIYLPCTVVQSKRIHSGNFL